MLSFSLFFANALKSANQLTYNTPKASSPAFFKSVFYQIFTLILTFALFGIFLLSSIPDNIYGMIPTVQVPGEILVGDPFDLIIFLH